MPDIQLRFHKDMLVLSAPLQASLAARGVSEDESIELLLINEPETVLEPLRLQLLTGAPCLVLPTAGITRARLAHARAENYATDIAQAVLAMANQLNAQHYLAEIGPTGLPLDPTSKTSLIANRDQYADAARLFTDATLDGLLLNDFLRIDDLRCALMGVRKVYDAPVFASVVVNEDGNMPLVQEPLEDAIAVMAEYGASVVGVKSCAAPEQIAAIVKRMREACSLPILVQIDVQDVCQRDPYDASKPYWHADTFMQAADILRTAGTQFLQATGQATSSYTGALVAATMGLDVIPRGSHES